MVEILKLAGSQVLSEPENNRPSKVNELRTNAFDTDQTRLVSPRADKADGCACRHREAVL
jgi:hypothetical protein